MEKFTRVCGPAAPLFLSDINTDTLMPSNWNVAHPDRLGEGLMRHWRYDQDNNEIADFVLNKERFKAAKFLVAGSNFGSGSSRETAVWALVQYGIRAVIAPDFGEIFVENAYQNGVLPISLPLDVVRDLASYLETAANPEICVDLAERRVELPDGRMMVFEIGPDRQNALLRGLDATLALKAFEEDIRAFQARDAQSRPWIYSIEK